MRGVTNGLEVVKAVMEEGAVHAEKVWREAETREVEAVKGRMRILDDLLARAREMGRVG